MYGQPVLQFLHRGVPIAIREADLPPLLVRIGFANQCMLSKHWGHLHNAVSYIPDVIDALAQAPFLTFSRVT
jgi:hypothetical protein